MASASAAIGGLEHLRHQLVARRRWRQSGSIDAGERAQRAVAVERLDSAAGGGEVCRDQLGQASAVAGGALVLARAPTRARRRAAARPRAELARRPARRDRPAQLGRLRPPARCARIVCSSP